MEDQLAPGLHEALITRDLRDRIERARADGWLVDWQDVDDARLAAILARHVHDRAREAIERVPSTVADRRLARVELVNRALEVLAEYGATSEGADAIDPEATLLMEVGAPGRLDSTPTPRPGIPLRDSALLVNGHKDLQIGTQVPLEILSADRIDLLCAFVRFAGVRLMRRELQEFLLRRGEMRVIASVYTGSTEKRALDELVGLGAKVKVSYETSQTRLHAKAWLFERDTGFHTAYVGSSNLTHSALLDGLEWNVRLTEVESAHIIDRIRATFEQYWNEPEFEAYDPYLDGDRLEAALASQRGQAGAPTVTSYASSVEPKPFQAQILEALRAERQRGHFRNLVVAPTGTGKTWVSAFDYAQLRASGFDTLLFVAHRNEILQQSLGVFRRVLADDEFGELFVGGERPEQGKHVFASIQSLQRRVEELEPRQFDVVIVDEFHHAEAATYVKLLRHLRPAVLIGLTATPERSDTKDVLHWFEDRVASEMRLWDALDQGLLCPFHYLGVGDGTDLSGVAFQRGRYVTSDLENTVTGDHMRAKRILEAVNEWVLDPPSMRALGFCVGVQHARFMADQFNQAGLRAIALSGETEPATRLSAIDQLRRGELQAIFTVEIFNEGVDIPEVDTLLLLRPTESATVFLQQLGRGLRWAPGKSVLTVLDFIGQAHAEYRFDIRYRALIGGTRRQVERAVLNGFPLLPPGCAIRLDEIAQEIVLENLRAAIRTTRRGMLDDLRGLSRDTRLPDFLQHSSFDLFDVYSSPASGSTFTALRRAVRHLREPAPPQEHTFDRAIGRMLHVDDEERYTTWRGWFAADEPPSLAEPGSREERLQWMLFAALGQRKRPLADVEQVFRELWASDELRNEFGDLLDVLRERSRRETRPFEQGASNPLHTHATYGLYEILAAYGVVNNGALRENREGVLWVDHAKSDLFFITLNKQEGDYSPTTRYQDYPISQSLFHWESQSRTASASPTGQRYIHHERRGSNVVLFVRDDRRDERDESNPYLCLGPARYVSHKADRPMQVIWELERPMPADLFSEAKVAAG